MVKVLFSCVPGFGHFHPLVPLAQALAAAGHDVAFATAPRFCQRVVEPAGFTALPAGLSPPEVHRRTQELPEVAGLDESDVWRFGAHMFAGVAAPAKVDDLVTVLERWPADLVVHDMTDFAGPVAAAVAGVAWAGHSFGAVQAPEFWELGGELVAPIWRARGMEPRPRGGMFDSVYLDICPPSFQDPSIATVEVSRPLRPVPFDNPAGQQLPGWVDRLAPGPTVYMTMGTIMNHTPGVFETVLEALASEAVNVIVTVGQDREPAELGSQPGNIHVERYLPQSLVFPRCDLVVCHGGSGTTLAALAHGLPLLVLPQGANQFWNAERCAELGVGRRLTAEELTADAVRHAVMDLLDDPNYRARAGGVAAEIAAMPAPAEVVPLLEELAGR